MKTTEFAGTTHLARLILRRDRILIALWLLLTVLAPIAGASAVATTYPTVRDRQLRLDQIDGTAMFVIFQGRAFGDTTAALAGQQGFATTVLLASLGAALLVARHTRGEEAAGRRDLLGSSVTGRHAPLTAALVVTGSAGIVIAGAVMLALIGLGLPAPGAAVMGGIAAAATCLASSYAAVASQLTTRAGVAAIGAAGLVYVLHFLRGIVALGDQTSSWLLWLIPNGWLEESRPFAGDRWWPLALTFVLALSIALVAGRLSARRDIGAALVRPRRGPLTANRALRGPATLALRLHRPDLIAFTVFLLAMGFALGAGGSGAMDEYGKVSWVQQYAAEMRISDPADALYVYVAFTFVFITGAHAVLTVLRLHRDEISGLAGNMLSGPVPRSRWALSQLMVALAAPIVLQFSLGLGLGLGAWSATGENGELGRSLGLTLPLVVAVWVIVAIAFAAFGFRARLAPWIAWTALTLGIVVEIAVKAGAVPEWLYRLTSPFGMISPYFQPTPVTYAGMILCSVVLITVGVSALRRRNLSGG